MNTRTYAVIGWPLGHSLSPIIQQAAFDAAQLDATYVAIPTPPGDEQRRFDEVRKGELSGLNVTIPHKHAAFHAMDSLTEAANRLGAVNTVICDNGQLRGDNTDTVILEATSELRLVAIAAGEHTRPDMTADDARRFLSQVLALNLDLLLAPMSEADRTPAAGIGPSGPGTPPL